MFVLIALETGLRLFAARLPERLQPVVHYVQTGRLYEANRGSITWWSGEFGAIFPPDLQDEPVQLSPIVNARVMTINLWDIGVGFRTPPIDYSVDMVVVGDSHSFCFTEYEDCWVTRLRPLTNKGIVNFGQPGTGSINHRNIVNRFAAPLEPSLVLWQWTGNDFNEDYGLAVERGEIERVPDYQLSTAPVAEHTLVNRLRRNSLTFAIIDSLINGNWSYVDHNEKMFVPSHYIAYEQGYMGVGRLYEDVVYDIERPANALGLPYTRRMIAEAKAQIEGWHGELVLVLFPPSTLVYQHLSEPLLGEALIARQYANYSVPRAICDDLNLRCIDLLPIFQEHARRGEHLYYTDDGHLNPHGNAVMAQAIADWLQTEGWLD